jgi:integrase
MAAKWEIIPAKPPMPTIKADNKRTRIITDAEEPAIFQAVEARRLAESGRDWKRYAALLRFLLDTGARLGEALAVRDDWIEEVAGSWKLNIPANVTKNGKARTLPLTPAIVETLPYLRLASADGRLFPMSAASAQYYWGNIRDDLAPKFDLSDVVLHTFRHTCLTRLAKRLPIHVVSKWAGHSDISITAGTYTHLDTDDLQAGVDVLSGK